MVAQCHPCRCCGYHTLEGEPPGTYELCPICGWEDSVPGDDYSGSNAVTLKEAQANFMAYGACEAEWRDLARPPTPADVRVADWRPLVALEDDACAAARAAIEVAFGTLRRGDGMRIYEAELADDYGVESERSAARRDDDYQDWRAIDDAILAEHYSVLSFFDPPGFRFHLAAYMTWSLAHYRTSESASVDFTIYALCPNTDDARLRAWFDDKIALFDEAQRQACAGFLRFMLDHAADVVDARVARLALEQYWHRYDGT